MNRKNNGNVSIKLIMTEVDKINLSIKYKFFCNKLI